MSEINNANNSNNTLSANDKLNKQINLAIEAACTSYKLAVVLSGIQWMHGARSKDSNPLSVWQGWDKEFYDTLNKHLELLELDRSAHIAAGVSAAAALKELHSQQDRPL